MKKHSLEAKELLTESEMFEIKAGGTNATNGEESCGICETCVGCTTQCTVCTTAVSKIIPLPL